MSGPASAPRDNWDPAQYDRFRAERSQPFVDLVALVRPRPVMRVLDLGCGTGELTATLLERWPDAIVEGIDASPAMLAEALPRAGERLSFRQARVEEITDFAPYDLILSNAVFQWVPENEALVRRILSGMRPGAQIAVQLPRNEGHPSHQLAETVARESPFREQLDGYVRRSEALPLERYAELLYAGGCPESVCIEKIYGHLLPHTADVVEWVKGTMLSAYLSRLEPDGAAAFERVYRERLLAAVGEHAPYFYPFRRVLFWGEKAA